MKAATDPPRALLESDDRDDFDSGRESINAWFRRHAWANHVNNVSRVIVLSERESGRLVGYYTLSAAQIERAFLPKPQQRKRPDPLPAILLGQLAVDVAYHGQGHGADLLLHAYHRVLAASQTIGCIAMITHPLDEAVRGFYAKWGFEDLSFDPKRAMIVRVEELAKHLT